MFSLLTKRIESKLLHILSTVSLLIQAYYFWLMNRKYVNICLEICIEFINVVQRMIQWWHLSIFTYIYLYETWGNKLLFVLHTYWQKHYVTKRGRVARALFRMKHRNSKYDFLRKNKLMEVFFKTLRILAR